MIFINKTLIYWQRFVTIIPLLQALFALGYRTSIVGCTHHCTFGSPLLIGVGIGENFIASDQLAASSNRFMYLEEGDIAKVDTQQHSKSMQMASKLSVRYMEIDAAQHNADKGNLSIICSKRDL